MNVLIAGETSGKEREAFRARGHNAWSNDFLPCEDGSPYHLLGDMKYAVKRNNGFFFKNLGGHTQWDLVIFHPTCTYLANSSNRWLYEIPKKPRKGTVYGPARWDEMRRAARFFEWCLGRETERGDQEIPMRAVENPIMHKHARELINCDYDQIIQPWMFGHREMKATCLWLRNLPKLEPTKNVGPPPKDPEKRKKWAKVHRASPGPNRWKERSRAYSGIADAMGEQWG